MRTPRAQRIFILGCGAGALLLVCALFFGQAMLGRLAFTTVQRYLSEDSLPFPEARGPLSRTLQKLSGPPELTKDDRRRRSIALTVDDLNQLLRAARLRQRLYLVAIHPEGMEGFISFPLYGRQHFLNGRAYLQLVYDSGTLSLSLLDLFARGQRLEKEYSALLSRKNLLESLYVKRRWRFIHKTLQGISGIRLEEGVVVVDF